MQRLRTVPFAILLMPFMAGIIGGYHAGLLPAEYYWGAIAVGAVFLLAGICFSAVRQHFLTVALLWSLFAAGWWLTGLRLNESAFPYAEQEAVYRIHVLSIPDVRDRSVRCDARVLQRWQGDSVTPVHHKIRLSLQRDSAAETLAQGDILLVQTAVSLPRSGNPEEFRYDDYLRLQGFAGTAFCYRNAWERIGNKPVNTLIAKALRCQHALVETLRRQPLGDNELALVAALALGYRNELDTDTKRRFSAAGAMHVLAVSGLHVGIVYGVLMWLLTGFGAFPVQYAQRRRRIANTLVVIVFLWCYAFLTGLSPSVVRSALMFSLLCIANALERESNTCNTIAAAAFITLLANPLLLYSISFLLSYSAVLSIVTLMPRLNGLIHVRWRPLRWLWQLACLSVAAQVGTLPWTLWWFGQTSNYFLLTNLIVVPAAGIVIYTALAVLLLSATPLAAVSAALLQGEAWLLDTAVGWVERLPGAVSHPPLTLPMLWCLWGVVLCLVAAFVFRRWKPLLGAAGCSAMLLGAMLFQLQQTRHTRQLVIWNTYRGNTLLFMQGRDCLLLTDNPADALQQTGTFRRRRMLRPPQMYDISGQSLCSFCYGGSDFLLVRDSVLCGKTTAGAMPVDNLLLGDVGRISPKRLATMLQAQQVFLMPTMKAWKARQFSCFLQQAQTPCRDLRSGAVVLNAGPSTR